MAKRPLKGIQRKDAPPNLWRNREDPWDAGDERFSVELTKRKASGKAGDKLLIDDWVTGLSWEDAGPHLRGTLSLAKPHAWGERPLGVRPGDSVVCRVFTKAGGDAKEVWRMRVVGPVAAEALDGTMEVALQTDYALYRRSRGDFKYVKGRRHRRGWSCDEITRDVCERFRIPYVREELPRGRHKIEKLVRKNVSPMEIIAEAYRREAGFAGYKFAIHFRHGRLNVDWLRYPEFMYILGPAIVGATVERSVKGSYATAVEVKRTIKKDGKREKISSGLIVNERGARRSGFVRRLVHAEAGNSAAALKGRAKRYLARQFKPRYEVTVRHPGVPWVRRGDALRLYVPEEGVTTENGQAVICFVNAVTHTVAAGEYTMEITVRFADPFLDERKARSKQRREDKKRKRKRTRDAKHAPKPKKSEQRS